MVQFGMLFLVALHTLIIVICEGQGPPPPLPEEPSTPFTTITYGYFTSSEPDPESKSPKHCKTLSKLISCALDFCNAENNTSHQAFELHGHEIHPMLQHQAYTFKCALKEHARGCGENEQWIKQTVILLQAYPDKPFVELEPVPGSVKYEKVSILCSAKKLSVDN